MFFFRRPRVRRPEGASRADRRCAFRPGVERLEDRTLLSAGDLGIQNAIKRLYHLETHPTPTVVKRYAEEGNWRPHATAACFYLWDSLNNAPG